MTAHAIPHAIDRAAATTSGRELVAMTEVFARAG